MTNIHTVLDEYAKQFAVPIAKSTSRHDRTRVFSLREVSKGVLDEKIDVHVVEYRSDLAVMILCEDANVAYSTSTAGMAAALGCILDDTSWVIDYVSNEDVPESIATVIDGRIEEAAA